MSFENKCTYINDAINETKIRSKAYEMIGIAKSTVQSLMKTHNYVFDKNSNQFVPREAIDKSMIKDNTKEVSMEVIHRKNEEVSMDNEMQITTKQELEVLKKVCSNWNTLEKMIKDYNYKENVIDVDTTVTLKDLPDSVAKRVNWDINNVVLAEFKDYIKKEHKNNTLKNMVELALLQFIKDKR